MIIWKSGPSKNCYLQLCKVEDCAQGVNPEQKVLDNFGNLEFKLHLDFDFDLDKELVLNIGRDEEPILIKTSVNRIVNSLNGFFLENGNGLTEIVDRVNQELVGLDFDVIRDEDFFIFFLPCNFRALVFDLIDGNGEINWSDFKSNFDYAQGTAGSNEFGHTANYIVCVFNREFFGNAKLANGCSISQTHISISFVRGQWFRINRNGDEGEIIFNLAPNELSYPLINCLHIEELDLGMAAIYFKGEIPKLIDYYDQKVEEVYSDAFENIAFNPILLNGRTYVLIHSRKKHPPPTYVKTNRPRVDLSELDFSFISKSFGEVLVSDNQKINRVVYERVDSEYAFQDYCWNLYSAVERKLIFSDYWPSGMAAWTNSGVLLLGSEIITENTRSEPWGETCKILAKNCVEFELFRGAALQLELAIYTSWILDFHYENYKRSTLQRCHNRFKFLLGSSVLNYSIRQTPKALLRTIIQANETFDAYEDYYNDLMDDARNSSWDEIIRQGLEEIRDDNPDFFKDYF